MIGRSLTLISRLLCSLLLISSSFAGAESPLSPVKKAFSQQQEFLPANEAFVVSGGQSENGMLSLDWKITPGYYLYKSRFKFTSADVNLGEAVFPHGIVEDDPYIGKTEIYKENFSIKIPIKKSKETVSTAILKVTFQGCAEAGFCYPPETIDVAIAIDNFSSTQASTTKPGNESSAAVNTTFEHGLFIYILFAMLGGMILNLMPCVFPILSIKVLSFKSSAENPHHLKIHGWVYTAGVILSFIAIAALLMYLRGIGEKIGWGFQLQNPPFITTLIILFFMMGLHLFGFFAIDSSLATTGQSLTRGHHFTASFFTGLLSVLVATPCTVPLMAPAIGFALTQSTFIALIIFASLGFGLALPFLLLAHFPTCIARLPKSGAWMQHLKQLLAFPLFLTAIWLLWVLDHETSINYTFSIIVLCAALAFTVWLWQLGYKKIMTLLLIVTSVLLYYGTHYEKHNEEPFSQARFDELRLAGEPVLINMTADWCITCLVNERVALSTSSVKNALKEGGVHYLKGDWTNQNPEITTFLKQFNRSGVPLYVYYPKGVAAKPVLLPQLLTPNIVIDAVTVKTTKP